MIRVCEDCNRTYDDAQCWTICPHGPLRTGLKEYCPKCDTVRSLHGPCVHQVEKDLGGDDETCDGLEESAEKPLTLRELNTSALLISIVIIGISLAVLLVDLIRRMI